MADQIPPSTQPFKEGPRTLDMRELGQTGLKRFSGFIYEEFQRELLGWKGIAIYKEMSTDAIVSSVLKTIQMMCRQVKWRVDGASSQSYDEEAKEFLESCMDDMSATWIDFIDQVLSFLLYGHSYFEICYKKRLGEEGDAKSKYEDGRIGWKKISGRSQDTIYRWDFDDNGGVKGIWQISPPTYQTVYIPIEKSLLFRTTTEKNNPEGCSIFRGAYKSWYMKKNIENIEGIGIERDLAGLPVIYGPPEIFSPNASIAEKALFNQLKQIVVNIRRDEQEGVVMPLAYNAEGKQIYDLKLLSTGGSRQFDTDKVVQRHDRNIAMNALADFILLGHEKVGSFALSSSKTNLFAVAMGGFLDMVCEVINRFAVPRLFELNDFQISDYPKIQHGDIESVDLTELGNFLTVLANTGAPLFPNDDLTKFLYKSAGLPWQEEENKTKVKRQTGGDTLEEIPPGQDGSFQEEVAERTQTPLDGFNVPKPEVSSTIENP